MPKGQRDFGLYAPTETIVGLSDMGELAARLGSIITFDRQGNVMAFDDFESGIEAWVKSGSAGYGVSWNSVYAKAGGFSCKLETAAVVGYNVTTLKQLGLQTLSPIGLEVSFAYGQNWKSLDIVIYIVDGSKLYHAAIRYDYPNTKLLYLDSANAYQDVPGGSFVIPSTAGAFHTLKFVVDLPTGKYKRLLVDNNSFDLSALSFYNPANPSIPAGTFRVTLSTSTGAAAIAYIDNVIITQNEP